MPGPTSNARPEPRGQYSVALPQGVAWLDSEPSAHTNPVQLPRGVHKVRGANRATRKEEEVRQGAQVALSLGACAGSGACGEREGAATTHTRLGCSHTVYNALGGLGPDTSRERGSVTPHPHPSQHTHITHWRGMGRTSSPPSAVKPPLHPTHTPQPPCPTCRAGSVALWVVQPGGTPKAPRGTGSCSAVDAIEPAVARGGAVSSELRRAQGVHTKGCGGRGTAA